MWKHLSTACSQIDAAPQRDTAPELMAHTAQS